MVISFYHVVGHDSVVSRQLLSPVPLGIDVEDVLAHEVHVVDGAVAGAATVLGGLQKKTIIIYIDKKL